MEVLTGFYHHLALGVHEAVTLANLWYCFVGVFLGCLVGVLPGLGSLVAISLLLPITFHLPATGALIMLAGVYFGADYGGGTCSILLGVPGHPGAAVDVLDGYPMAQQGRGGIALFMKCVASFWGSAVGIILLMLFAPALAEVALKFGPAEYCALMLLGLLAAATVGRGSPVKGVAMMVVGLLFGIVGTDVNSGTTRFAFGAPELIDGIGLIPIAMGLFAIAEVIRSAGRSSVTVAEQKFTLRDQLPTREDWRRSVAADAARIGRRLVLRRAAGDQRRAWRPSSPTPSRSASRSTRTSSARARSRASPRPRRATTRASAPRSSRRSRSAFRATPSWR